MVGNLIAFGRSHPSPAQPHHSLLFPSLVVPFTHNPQPLPSKPNSFFPTMQSLVVRSGASDTSFGNGGGQSMQLMVCRTERRPGEVRTGVVNI